MQLKKLFSFLLYVLLPLVVSAQLKVNNITLNNLKKTKAEYLNRFLETKSGDSLDLNILEEDLQRLKNLNNIIDGEYKIDTSDQNINISFQLKDAISFFPIINFGGVEGNFWYQLGFSDDNWLGRGQKLTAFYQNNDGRNNFSLFYKIPYFNRSRWGASFSFFKWASIEPLFFDDATVFYDYDNISFGISSLYELNRKQSLELGLTYFVENYNKNSRHEGTTTPGPDGIEQPKLLAKLIHHQNNFQYHYFYLDGLDNVASLQTVYNFFDKSWFYIFLNDTKYFKRIAQKSNLGFRLRVGFASNKDTPFAPFVLDSYINIRGSGNRIERGTAALILNIEFRQTIFDRPKIAGQVVAFSDTGSWRNPGGELNDLVNGETLQQFVGSGFRLIYKRAFDAVLRIDYGIDVRDFNRRGFVLGFGQYF